MGRKYQHNTIVRWGCIIIHNNGEQTNKYPLKDGKLQNRFKPKKHDVTSKFEKYNPNSSSGGSFSSSHFLPLQHITNETEASLEQSNAFSDTSSDDNFSSNTYTDCSGLSSSPLFLPPDSTETSSDDFSFFNTYTDCSDLSSPSSFLPPELSNDDDFGVGIHNSTVFSSPGSPFF